MRAPTPSPRLPFWLIGLLAASLLGLATIVYYFLKPLDGPVPNDAGIAYSALEQGKTSEGFPRLGRADAPIIVEEFSSYACSHCRAFHEGRLPDLLDNIAAGQVQYILIPMGHIGSGADNAVRAAFCAGEQDRFWAMHDVLFSWQKKFLTRTFDPKRINKGAANLGLDLAVFDECVDAARTRSQIDLGLQIFRERGLSGTPSFFINGRQIVDYAEFDELDSAPDLPGGGESLLNTLPIIVDTHQDIAWNYFNNGRDFTKGAFYYRRNEHDPLHLQRYGYAMTGAPEALLGRVAVICASIFVCPTWRTEFPEERMTYSTPQEAHDLGLRQIDYYHRLDKENDHIQLIHTRADLDTVLESWQPERSLLEHRLGLIIGMEGADPILEPLELEEWIARGLRLVGPAWTQTRYSGGTHALGPLTNLGRELLDIMANNHMVLDLAHMAPEATLEALERYDGPVMASHANPLCFCPDRPDRNLSDDVICRIAEHDGLVGIMPYNLFLLEGWRRGNGKEAVSLDYVTAAVDHVCQITGSARYVGLGSDFDGGFGAESTPAGLDTVADLLTLGPALAERGYTSEDIAAILSGNALRVLRAGLPE